MRRLAMLVAMGVLAVWATWPLASCLSRCLVDPQSAPPLVAPAVRRDVDLTLWILAWTTHALTTDPMRLFDANIFHPAPLTLTASEHMLGALPIYLPLALASGDPVWAHQATLLATFVLSALALAALVQAWTGSWPAAFAAGAAFAYSPFHLDHAHVLPMGGIQYLPLIVLAAERTVTARAPARWAAVLGVLLTVQALHSYYLAYATFVMTGILLAVVLAGDAGARRRWTWLLGALAVAAGVVVIVSWPYVIARRGGALEPPNAAFVQLASARPGKTGATWMTLVALAALPLWRRGVRGRVAAVWLLGLAVAALTCHLLALGPVIRLGGLALPGPFALAARLVPGWQLVRAPLRLSAPAVLGACTLAGVGLAGLIDVAGHRRRLAGALVVALAVVLVAATVRRPLVAPTAETRAMVPDVYGWLATAPRGPVVEIPFHPFRLVDRGRDVEARRTYRSIVHWQPILGGYSGYAPPSHAAVSALAQALPDPRAATLLERTTGLRWIVLHRDELDRDARRAWRRLRGAYRVVGRFDRDLVLQSRLPSAPDLVEAFIGENRSVTPLGTSRAPLAAADRRGMLAFEAPLVRAPRGKPVSPALRVRNDGRTTWPALGGTVDGLVTLGYRWVDAAGGVKERGDAGRMPWDLAPGEEVIAHLVVGPPPRGAGPLRLEVGLVQDGRWFDEGLSRCFDPGGAAVPCDRRRARHERVQRRRGFALGSSAAMGHQAAGARPFIDAVLAP